MAKKKTPKVTVSKLETIVKESAKGLVSMSDAKANSMAKHLFSMIKDQDKKILPEDENGLTSEDKFFLDLLS